MTGYILRRLLLMAPTLLGIMLVTFVIVQFAPGGPVERVLAQLSGFHQGGSVGALSSGGDLSSAAGFEAGEDRIGEESLYRGARGLDPEFIAQLEKQFGFDRPAHERFVVMIWNYLRFDFGESYYRDISVVDLIIEKMPVSISLGLWITLLVYLISIPLGIRKAVRDGSSFDVWTSLIVVIGYAAPGFLFAIILIVLFAGGTYWTIFPLRGLVSENWSELSAIGKVLDYFWHLTLPLIALGIGAFAATALLAKNAFLDEINKQYVVAARAKGLTERRLLYGHVFRNAMLIIIAGFPGAFLGAFFSGSLLIEWIFSLDGLGLLSFNAVLNRDYPVVFATLYIFSLMGMIVTLISDLTYMWVDPRIDFESRET